MADVRMCWAGLLLAALATGPAASAASAGVSGEIGYALADRVYLDRGASDGLQAGQQVFVDERKATVAELRIETVFDHHSVATIISRKRVLRPGDRFVVRQARPLPASAPASRPAAPLTATVEHFASATATGFSRVPFQSSAATPLVRRGRAEAFLRNQTWLYFDSAPLAAHQRGRLDLRLDAAIDAADHWHVDADASAVGELLHPADARLGRGSPVWLEVYRLSVAWRGIDGLELALGRRPSQQLRYGLVDGAFTSWRLQKNGPTLRLALGTRPDSVSLIPGASRPTVAGDIDGVARWSWGSLSYGAALGWMAHDYWQTEAGEGSARLALDLWRALAVDGDVGGMLWLGPGSVGPQLTFERVALGASLRLWDALQLRVAGRRLAHAALPTELALLPAGYLGGEPSYDVYGSANLALAPLAAIPLGLGVDGGVIWDAVHWQDRYWFSPGLSARFVHLWQLQTRLAYRCELGESGAQLGEVGFDLAPVAGLRAGLMQQGGVLVLQQTQQVRPTFATWLHVDWRVWRWIAVGLRGRALYGRAGNGLEVNGWIGAVDWM